MQNSHLALIYNEQVPSSILDQFCYDLDLQTRRLSGPQEMAFLPRRDVLDRPLKTEEEIQHFTDTARRIAAILELVRDR